jgi:hypothetical protein
MTMDAHKEQGETAITIWLHKPIEQWSREDQKAIVERLKEYFKQARKGRHDGHEHSA